MIVVIFIVLPMALVVAVAITISKCWLYSIQFNSIIFRKANFGRHTPVAAVLARSRIESLFHRSLFAFSSFTFVSSVIYTMHLHAFKTISC